MSPPPPHSPATFSLARYAARQQEIALQMSHFLLGYLKEIHLRFEGDLTLVIVLAEIAHHSSEPRFPRAAGGGTATLPAGDAAVPMPSCSAYSLAAATGLPRETVRRKIARLAELGWVEKTGRAEFRLTPKVAEHFTPDFNVRLLDQLLQTADRIRGMLSTKTQTP